MSGRKRYVVSLTGELSGPFYAGVMDAEKGVHRSPDVNGAWRTSTALATAAAESFVKHRQFPAAKVVPVADVLAHAAGYAEGRAAERAAVVTWLYTQGPTQDLAYFAGELEDSIKAGAHVGAAKRSGT